MPEPNGNGTVGSKQLTALGVGTGAMLAAKDDFKVCVAIGVVVSLYFIGRVVLSWQRGMIDAKAQP